MMSRREIVTTGVMGSLAAAVPAGASETETLVEQANDQILRQGFGDLKTNTDKINSTLQEGLVGPSIGGGFYISKLREQFTNHLRSAGKFPEFCDIGIICFYDVYDWHVRHMQQIVITRAQENRMAIQFMFTQLILRYEQDPKYVGLPYDK